MKAAIDMGWRIYGEPEPEESPVGEFFCWLIGLGFPVTYGWPFVSLGWIYGITLIEISGSAGALIGLRMAWHSARRKKQRGII